MEDILASIRRILNEDETTPAAPPVPSPAAVAAPAASTPAPAVARLPAPELAEEPLDLTEDMLIDPPPVAPEPIAAPPPPPAPVPLSPPVAPAPEPSRAVPIEGLVAPAVAAAASASVGELLRTVAQERSSAISRGGPTIEDVVREELRPLLKAWLDAHLPGMVERLVRTEIERVVGRALS